MSRRVLIGLELLLLAAAAWQTWEVGAAMAARLQANFDLEWMEGATLITGLRASEGLPFYTRPSPDYVPFIYPPLYAWILGLLAQVFPLGYTLGRAVSIVSTVAASAAIVFGAWREGARPALALGCGALFLGCYADGGTFYDLVRTDALSIALLGWALVLARRWPVAGGLLLAVAFAAKHHAALFGFPLVFALWRTEGRATALRFAVASVVPALLFTIAMQVQTGGLFVTYLLGVPANHGIMLDRALPNLGASGRPQGAQWELWKALPITTTAVLLLTWRWPIYWIGVAITGLLTASLMRGHHGGYLNVLIPMLWIQALLPALALRASAWRFTPHLVTLLVAVQVVQGRESLARYLPRPADAQNAERLIDELRALPEPLLIPHAPWYGVLAGHAPSLALITLWDIDHTGGPLDDEVRVIRDAMAGHHWASIVIPDGKLGYDLRKYYRVVGRIESPAVPTRTGWNVRLKQVWAPALDGDAAPATPSDE